MKSAEMLHSPVLLMAVLTDRFQ